MRRAPAVLAVLAALSALAVVAHAQHPPPHARHHGHARHAVRISARYVRMRARWHRAASAGEVRRWEATATRPPLVLRPVADGQPVTILPSSDEGGFDAVALAEARTAMHDRRTQSEHDVHPVLLDRIYRAARHFHAPWAWVVSGYRANAGTSRHAMGRACDVVLPGVTDARLAAWARTEGFSGVGTYPLSGFVHIDVRDRSYFWIDRSAPGARNRTRRVRDRDALRFDMLARRRGVTPPIGIGDAEAVGPERAPFGHDDHAAEEEEAGGADEIVADAPGEPAEETLPAPGVTP